ncbi:1229_t:CDS:2, partial [Paraglomus occultum]
KYIRNKAFKTCISLPSPAASDSCSPISTTLCPTDRFSNTSSSASLQWHTVTTSSASSTNSTQFQITSTPAYSQTKLCLTSTAGGVQACTCDETNIAQTWIADAGQVKTPSGSCLVGTATGNAAGGSVGVGVGLCGGESAQWDIYHTTPGSVALYSTSYFFSEPMNLLPSTYTSQTLPSSIFSAPFSLEIPPGFEFIVRPGNNVSIVFSSDTPQIDPISDLTTAFQVGLKDGVIVYEQPAYFGFSWFLSSGFGNGPNNTVYQNATTTFVEPTGNSFSFDTGVGSVMVKDGFKAVMWDTTSKNGDNFGLFETVANFEGVLIATARKNVQNADISAGRFRLSILGHTSEALTDCTPDCASGGFCSGKNVCTCSPGFTGALCDQCLPGFWGPTCQ